MCITSIESFAVGLPMRKPVIMVGETVQHPDNMLVRVATDNGLIGWGEAAPAPLMTGETLASIVAAVHHLKAALQGRNSVDIVGARRHGKPHVRQSRRQG